MLDVSLKWNEEVVTSCGFEQHPDWSMLSLKVEGPPEGSPSKKLPRRVAAEFRKARSPTP